MVNQCLEFVRDVPPSPSRDCEHVSGRVAVSAGCRMASSPRPRLSLTSSWLCCRPSALSSSSSMLQSLEKSTYHQGFFRLLEERCWCYSRLPWGRAGGCLGSVGLVSCTTLHPTANREFPALAHKINRLSTICTSSPNNSNNNNNNNKTDSTALLTASSTLSVLAERERCQTDASW